MKNLLILIFSIGIVFSSCSENHTFAFEKKIDNSTWAFSDPFVVSASISDISTPYDIILQIDHGEFYAYENIYLRIEDNFTGNTHIDTIGFNLSDKYGFWIGEKNGEEYQNNKILRKSFMFPNKGNYIFKVEQFTRSDSLKEIRAIRLYIDKTSE